jgi:ClpP class serine protease
MTTTRDEVVALAQALFGEKQAAQALALIDQYGTEAHEREVNRVQLAILEVSDGKLSRIPYFVKYAKIDYRDVLTGARLPPMNDAEETQWQASANRMLELWEKKPV